MSNELVLLRLYTTSHILMTHAIDGPLGMWAWSQEYVVFSIPFISVLIPTWERVIMRIIKFQLFNCKLDNMDNLEKNMEM